MIPLDPRGFFFGWKTAHDVRLIAARRKKESEAWFMGGGFSRLNIVDALLPIDQDLLALAEVPVLQPDRRVLPCDDVTHRIAPVDAIHQVAHLALVPHEGALDLRYGDLALLHPREQAFDEGLLDGIFLSLHGYVRLLRRCRQFQVLLFDRT